LFFCGVARGSDAAAAVLRLQPFRPALVLRHADDGFPRLHFFDQRNQRRRLLRFRIASKKAEIPNDRCRAARMRRIVGINLSHAARQAAPDQRLFPSFKQRSHRVSLLLYLQ